MCPPPPPPPPPAPCRCSPITLLLSRGGTCMQHRLGGSLSTRHCCPICFSHARHSHRGRPFVHGFLFLQTAFVADCRACTTAYFQRTQEFWRRLYKNGTSPPASLSAAGLGCLGPIPNNYTDCPQGKCTKCDMLGMEHATDMLNGAWVYVRMSVCGCASRRLVALLVRSLVVTQPAHIVTCSSFV
jgi:hypothetical protein